MSANLEDEYLESAAAQLAADIDFEIISGFLIETGWTKVERSPFVTETEKAEIQEWLENKTSGNVHSRNGVWLFEKDKDATMFILRWM